MNHVLDDIFPQEELIICINGPKTIFIDKEYYEKNSNYFFRTTLKLSYYDFIELNQYLLDTILQFRIDFDKAKVAREIGDIIELYFRAELEQILLSHSSKRVPETRF